MIELMQKADCEEIFVKYDKASGLRCFIVIDNSLFGDRAPGGIRMMGYKDEKQALYDGFKLAKAMTKKNVMYDLPFNGGKAVILGNPKKDKSKALFRSFGRFVNSLGGRFWGAVDMGLTLDDMKIILQETQFMDSVPSSMKKGGLGLSGKGTGIGVVEGMKVAAKKMFGTSSLKNIIVAVQGLGAVGSKVVELLSKEGATIIATDVNKDIANKLKSKFGITIVSPEKIYSVDCDIFSPCAMGGSINKKTISKLRCKLIAGGSNNQMEGELEGKHIQLAKKLAEKGILYIPDFVSNGGGIIQAYCEHCGENWSYAEKLIRNSVPKKVKFILAEAEKKNKLPIEVAENIVKEKIERARKAAQKH